MAGDERGVRRGLEQSQLPYLEHVGGESLSAPDSGALTIPREASCVEIAAEDGAVYWDFGNPAIVGSGGYIPEDGREWIGPMVRSDLQTKGINVLSSGTVHVMYYREN